MKYYIIFIFGLILVSCVSKKANIKSHLSEINIHLSDKIEVEKYKTWGLTDYIEESEFIVSDADKEYLIDFIKTFAVNINHSNPNGGYLNSSAYRTDTSFILHIQIPTDKAFIDHSLEIVDNYVFYNYWIE